MSSQVRNFIISFIIATLIFSVVAVFGVRIIDKYILNPEPDSTSNQTQAPSTLPSTAVQTSVVTELGSGSSFSFVLIGSDYQPDVYNDYEKPFDGTLKPTRQICADTIIFGMFSKELNEFVIMPIDPDTLVYLNGAKMTLRDAYGLADDEFICDQVSMLVGLSVDYYASVEMRSFKQIIDYLGGVYYNVPANIEYVNEVEGIFVSLERGRQLLNGEQALALLRYNSYSDRSVRINLAADFCVSALEQFTADYLNKYKYTSMYQYFSSRVKTNFTLADGEENLDLIFKFSSMTLTVLSYPGTVTENGFVADTEQVYEIFNKYR